MQRRILFIVVALVASVLAVAPAHAAGAARPTITRISPSSGPLGGGTRVTVVGTNLVNVHSVTFGGVASTHRSVASSHKSLTVTAPAHAVGKVDVVVSTAAGSATRAGAFRYGPGVTGSWHAPQLIDPPVDSPSYLSCPGGHCYGRDVYANFIDAGTGSGDWTNDWTNDGAPLGESVPADVKANCLGFFGELCSGLSCPQIGFCVSIDDQGRPLIWSGGTWHAYPTLNPPGRSNFGNMPYVSCATAQFCMIQDGSSDWSVWNGTSWSQPKTLDGTTIVDGSEIPSAPPPAQQLSCAGDTCIAIDSGGHARTFEGGTWSQPRTIAARTDIAALSCTNLATTGTDLLCVAAIGSTTDRFLRYSGGTWHLDDANPIAGGEPLSSASCNSDGKCLVVTEGGLGYLYGDSHAANNSHGWAGPFEIPDAARRGAVLATSCQSATTCTSTLANGFATTFDLTSRRFAVPTTILAPSRGISRLDCAADAGATSYCLSGDAGPSLVTDDGAGWHDPVEAFGRGERTAAVSCVDGARFCMAIADNDGYASRANHYATYSKGSLTVHPMLSGAYSALSCWSATGCYAVSAKKILRWNGQTWSQAVDLAARRLPVTDLSCAAGTSSCLAVTKDARWFRVDGSTTTTPTRIDAPVGTQLTFVSCQEAQHCVATTGSGSVYSRQNAVWVDQGWPPNSEGFPRGFYGFACAPSAADTSCVGVGELAYEVGYDGAVHYIGDGNDDTQRTDVTCPSTSQCIASDIVGQIRTYS